jgi:hypothetical protein
VMCPGLPLNPLRGIKTIYNHFRDRADGMRNVFRIDREGVAGGLDPSRAWST